MDDLQFYKNGLNKVLDFITEQIHPWYGPCDGFADGNCAECLRVLGALKGEATQEREQIAVAFERARCAQVCVNEFARWKDAERDSHGIAIGAIGAASNILCAIEGIPAQAETPLNPNEYPEARGDARSDQT